MSHERQLSLCRGGTAAAPAEAARMLEAVAGNIGRVILGKRAAIELCLVCLLSGGHVLVEDVPGVGKTMLVRALARSLDLSFRRIQFTPDLMPSDVTGVTVYNQQTRDFEFRPGPVVSHIVLADELNRASPRTQSALLEAMEEGSLTADGHTYPLPRPFLVFGTQNPVDFAGTFPLPEAQLDRFMVRLRLGYPEVQDEVAMLGRVEVEHPIHGLQPVLGREEVLALQEAARHVHVEDSVKEYIVRLVGATRSHPLVGLGASPRGSIALLRGVQALALLRGRPFALPDDVQALAVPVLAHRLLLAAGGRQAGRTEEEVVGELLETVPVPGTRGRRL